MSKSKGIDLKDAKSFTYEDMLDEIAASIAKPEIDREAGWFTINDVKRRVKMSRRSIAVNLEDRIEAGEMEKIQCYEPASRRVMSCYRKL